MSNTRKLIVLVFTVMMVISLQFSVVPDQETFIKNNFTKQIIHLLFQKSYANKSVGADCIKTGCPGGDDLCAGWLTEDGYMVICMWQGDNSF